MSEMNNSKKNMTMTKIEAAIARAEQALAESRDASAQAEQAINRAQASIDAFWANQNAALAKMREKADAPAATLESGAEESPGNAGKSCSCRDSGSRQEIDFYRADALKSRADALRMTGTQIDPDLLVDIVSDLLQLAGRMNERILTIERRTKRRRRKRRIAGYFVPPAF